MTVKECSETVFLESFLSKSLTVCNFQKKVAMTIIFFFSKCLKFDVDYWNGTKKSEKVFGFEVSYIWIGGQNFSQSGTGYLSLAVNMLQNTFKI